MKKQIGWSMALLAGLLLAWQSLVIFGDTRGNFLSLKREILKVLS